MAVWITTADLRGAAGAKQAADEEKYVEACAIACAEVERLCGPIAFTAVADEIVPLSGSREACLKYRATEGLTAVSAYLDGSALALGDYTADGQVFRRRDRGTMSSDLLVSYQTGYYRITSYNVCYTKLLRLWNSSPKPLLSTSWFMLAP